MKEEDELEWDDDCRVGTGEELELVVGEQLELEVGVREKAGVAGIQVLCDSAGVAGIEVLCNSAEKDEEEVEEEEKVKELHVT